MTTLTKAYEVLAARNHGVVKVPALIDALGLTDAEGHALLLRLADEDKVNLMTCSERWLEPEWARGIQTPRGTKFYVQMI